MNDQLRIIIVDDEPVARLGLRNIVQSHEGAIVAGECGSGSEAVDMIRAMEPDLVLLDIEMPDLDGFQVVQTIGVDIMPMVIFVTAFNQYALKAFDVHAFDYLLKPIKKDRVHEAIDRAAGLLQTNEPVTEQLQEVLSYLKVQKPSVDQIPKNDRLIVRDGSRIALLNVTDISWIEAAGNYVQIHVPDTRHLLRATMRDISERLAGYGFVRISRSSLVNSAHVVECALRSKGGYNVRLRTGEVLPSSRAHRENIEAMLSESV